MSSTLCVQLDRSQLQRLRLVRQDCLHVLFIYHIVEENGGVISLAQP